MVKTMNRNLRKSGGLLLAALLCVGVSLHADVQGRLNVVADALAGASAVEAQRIAVAGFVERPSGLRPPFSHTLESGLRKALIQANHWKVLPEGEDPAGADALLTGTFTREGDQVVVHAELRSSAEGDVLWSRNTKLEAAGLDAKDFEVPADEAAAPEESEAPNAPALAEVPPPSDQVIPTHPPRVWRSMQPFNFDLSVGYKAFFPTNSSFQNVAGARQDGLDFGLSFDDSFLVDFNFWSQDVSGLGTAQSLDYAGTDIAWVYPFDLGQVFTFYLGPGGRFGSIEVNDPALDHGGGVDFGNNGFTAVAGAKARLGDAGLDLRYTYDLLSSYTGYHTVTIGAFYAFGR
jgi:hypothetical protein